MKEIESLLTEAETGKTSRVFERITDEAKPFWDGIEERIIAGRPIKPYVVHRILRDEYGIKISETAVRNHFLNLKEQHGN